MEMFVHSWLYITQFFFKWDMFQTKVVVKIRTYFMLSIFFPEIVPLWDNVKKKNEARQAADDNIIWPMHIECWVTGVQTHTQNI